MAIINGNDLLNDSLNGGSGNDVIQGMGGNDTLYGRGGNDSLVGGDGNDYLNGGGGLNTLVGGNGNDTYEVSVATDRIEEGVDEGVDTVKTWINNYTLADNVDNLELFGTFVFQGSGNALANRITGNGWMNTLAGADGNDTLDGRSGNDLLFGESGDDSLVGGTGDDTLDGWSGNDVLAGGTGNDSMVGGTGDDTYDVDTTGDRVVEALGPDIDTVRATISYTLGDNVEKLVLVEGSGASMASGNALANTITGNALANVLRGGTGDDTIAGGGGADVLWGDTGNDLLRGGSGNDFYQEIRGGGVDSVEDSGAGETDVIRFSNSNVNPFQLWFTRENDNLRIGVIGTPGAVIVKDYYVNADHGWRVESMVLTVAFGIDRPKIDRLVSGMAGIPMPATTTLPSTGIYESVSNLVSRVWFNVAPTGVTLSSNSVGEACADGTVVGTLGSVDGNPGDPSTFTLLDDAGGRFVIVGNELRVANGALLDFEAQASHTVTIRVTDEGGLSFQQDRVINVTDVVETVTGSAGNDVLTGTAAREVIVGGTGDDTLQGGAGGDTLQGGMGSDEYRIDRADGAVVLQDGGPPMDNDVVKFPVADVAFDQLWFAHSGNDLVVSVLGTSTSVRLVNYFMDVAHGWSMALHDGATIDRDAIGDLVAAMAPLMAPAGSVIPSDGDYAALHALVLRTWYNHAPTDIALDSAHVLEGAANGTLVGTLAATDADAGDSATFTLLDNAGGRFVLDGALLKVADGASLVYDTATSHDVTVQVSDGRGATYSEVMAISLDPVRTLVTGTSAADSLDGTAGRDSITGLAGNDTLTGNAGGDILDGGDGADVYRVLNDGSVDRIQDSGALTDTEIVLFPDAGVTHRNLWLSTSGNDLVVRVLGTTTEVVIADWVAQSTHAVNLQLNDGAYINRTAINALLTSMNALAVPPGSSIPASGSYTALSELVDRKWYNQAPTDISLSSTTVVENAANGTVVAAISAVDPNAGDTKTYSLVDTAGGRFTIVGGNLAVANSSLLNYEAAQSHNVTIRVTDGQGATYQEVFTINVTDAVETINGGMLADVLTGGIGADVINGFGFIDMLSGGGGNDTIDGGADIDSAVYSGVSADFVVSIDPFSGITTVRDANTTDGNEGTDTLYAVEGLTFNDSSMLLSVQTTERLVNTTTAGGQYDPSVAALAQGGHVVVWTAPDAGLAGVYMQRFDAAGAKAGSESLVNTATADLQQTPVVAALADGGFVVAWTSSAQEGGVQNSDGIFLQRYDASGNKSGAEVHVNTTVFAFQNQPTIAGLKDGGYIVAWSSYIQDTGSEFAYGVITQRYNAAGAAVGGEVVVNTTTAGNQHQPTLTALSDGGYVVAWSSNQEGDYGIFAQRYNSAGTKVGGELHVNNTTAGDQLVPSVTSLVDGGYVVAWQSPSDGGGLGVYARLYNAQNVAVGNEFRVNTFTAGDQSLAAVAGLADGGFVVAWSSVGQDGSAEGIYLQRYNAAGIASGPETRLNTTTLQAQANVSITALPDGGYIATWQSDGQDGDGLGVYSQHFDSSGNVIGARVVMGSNVSTAEGGARSDLIQGNTLNNSLRGNAGDDTLVGAGGEDSALYNGQFSDYTLTSLNNALVRVRDNNPGNGSEGADTLVEVEKAVFASGLYVTAAGNGISVFGSMAAEVINVAGGGADVVRGGGGPGVDTISGDAQDTVVFGGPNTNYVIQSQGSALQLRDTYMANGDDGTVLVSGGARLVLNSMHTTRVAVDARVNSVTADLQVEPVVTSLADGGYIIGWMSGNQDGSGFGVYTQRYSAGGAPAGVETRVNTFVAGDQWQPSIAAFPGGGHVVCWSSAGQDGDAGGIYMQFYNASGVASSSEFLVNMATAGMQDFPVIACNNSRIVVAWSTSSINGTEVMARSFDLGGNPTTAEMQVNQYVASAQGGAAITRLSDGSFVVSWFSHGQAVGGGTAIDFRRLDANGNFAGAETQVTTTSAAGSGAMPSVAALTDGGFVITWQSAAGDVCMRRYTAAGAPSGGEVVVNSFIAGDQSQPAIAGLSDGGWVVTWQSNGQDGTHNIYQQRYDSAGTAWGEVLVNAGTAFGQQGPSVAALADGGYVITWMSESAAGGNTEIMQQRYTAEGPAIGTLLREVQGSVLADTMTLTSSSEIITPNFGNDTVNGNGGYDIVKYSGTQGDYYVSVGANGSIAMVQDLNAADGNDGTDQLATIERLEFGDGVAVIGTLGGMQVIGTSGNDRMNGSGGDDLFVMKGGSDTVNGGAGNYDTLQLAGGGITLDLRSLPDAQFTNIERIDMGTGSTLNLALADVLALSSSTDTLQVIGDGNDTVSIGGGWGNTGPITQDGYTFTRYQQSSAVLLIEQGITVTV